MNKEEVRNAVITRVNEWKKHRRFASMSATSYQYEYGMGIISGMISAFRKAGFITKEDGFEILEEAQNLI